MTDLLEVLKIQLANKSKRVNKEINKRSFFLGDEYNKSDKCQKINQDKSEHALIALSGFLKEYNNSFGPIESHTCVLNSVLNLIQLLYLSVQLYIDCLCHSNTFLKLYIHVLNGLLHSVHFPIATLHVRIYCAI